MFTKLPICVSVRWLHSRTILHDVTYHLQDLEEWSKIDVDAYIVVYSVTSRKSFQKGRDLMFNIRNLVQSDAAMILVANKSDLKRARCVPESGTLDLDTLAQIKPAPSFFLFCSHCLIINTSIHINLNQFLLSLEQRDLVDRITNLRMVDFFRL